MRALKNLGLNIRRAKIDQTDPNSKNKFYITDASTSEKVVKRCVGRRANVHFFFFIIITAAQ